MTADLAEILKYYIKDLPFIEPDRLAGLVKVAQKENKDGKIERYPLGYNLNQAECEKTGTYTMLIPDPAYKSIFYFEDLTGVRFVKFDPSFNAIKYTATLRLIGWLNTEKLQLLYDSASAIVTHHIIHKLPVLQAKNAVVIHQKYKHYQFIKVTGITTVPVGVNLFERYTYLETHTQYLTFPYTALGIDLTIDFNLSNNCLPELSAYAPNPLYSADSIVY